MKSLLEKFNLKELKIIYALGIGAILIFLVNLIYHLLMPYRDWAEIIDTIGWSLIFISLILPIRRAIKGRL